MKNLSQTYKRKAKTIIKQPLTKNKNGLYYAREGDYMVVFTTETLVGTSYPIIQIKHLSNVFTAFCLELQSNYIFSTDKGEIEVKIKGWMSEIEVTLSML